ncbi:MAG: D-alanyl-D-alanine carboxypeptidase [Comamonadaceae bacterium]|nr:D-alanyl-D-alanine carboxypeptidase [Comamonadaceae bacterium]
MLDRTPGARGVGQPGRHLAPAERTRARGGAAPTDATRVARHESRPWGEVLRPHEQGLATTRCTRLLYLQLGLAGMAAEPQAHAPPSWRGREVAALVRRTRASTARGLVLDNGSGLSRSERIAPRADGADAEGRAATVATHRSCWPSLPVAGVDGTMRRRLQGSAGRRLGAAEDRHAEERDRPRPATVRDTRGDTWVVVALVNHEQAARAWPALDALIDWVARSARAGVDDDAVRG